MSDPDTKTRILDCAESLFARDGYHNTSLRHLTTRAGVNLAAVNYHFGSKEALLQAVVERRLVPLNQVRSERLQAVLTSAEQRKSRPAVEELLRAFVEPTLAFRHSGPGARAFLTLIGRSLSEPDTTVRQCFLQQVMPLFEKLLHSLASALPQLPRPLLETRLHFFIGTLGHVMCQQNSTAGDEDRLRLPVAEKELVNQLVAFVRAGLEAP